MDKITYLAELAEGLARWVPERERRDILRYYAEYFEEAGLEREAEVVAELGDPWALSCRLAVEGGYVTQEKAASWRPKKTWRRVLLGAAVGLLVSALVFNIGMLATNVIWSSRSFTQNPALAEAEPVTVVDWGMSPLWYDEYSILYADKVDSSGVYFMDDESIAPFRSIDADINLGNIEVVAGDDYTLSVRRSEALSGYEPSWEITNGVLKLRDGRGPQVQAYSWDELKNLFGVGQRAMEVVITVPENAALDRVSVRTGLGDVLLWGLNAQTVTAETGLGDVECYAARNVRRLDLNTGLGNINLGMGEALDGMNVSLESGMDNVEATLCGFETDYSYTLESGWGAVMVNGNYCNTKVERRGNQPYQLSAESGKGDVNVYFTFG